MRVLLVCLAVVASSAFAAKETLPPTAETMAELRRIEAAGFHDGIAPFRIKYNEEARQRPGDPMPRVFVAWCTLPSDDAWNQLKAISTIFPDNPWVRYGMGRIYTNWRGMTDMARTEFEAVLKQDPKFFPAVVGLGDVARVKEDWATAEKQYRAALTMNDDPYAHAGLGLIFAAQKKNDEALVELKKAIAAQPEQPTALATLVTLSIAVKDPGAIAAASTLADLRPKDREARKQLADLRFEAGDKANAAKEYERLIRLGNATLETQQRLASLYRELGDAEGEERALQNVAVLDDKSPEPSLRMAELRFARKDFEGAEGQWLEALNRDPKNVAALEGLAKSKLEQSMPHEALEYFRRAGNAAQVEKLEGDFKLPKKKAKGSVNNVYAATQSSLAKAFPTATGKLRLRVRIDKAGVVDGVDVLEDTVKDPLVLGHVYFQLRDAGYPKQKGEPVFEFEMGKKGK
ncbi:MAG: tetratricopeptide repeat protein [Archangium sp.]